MLAGRHAIRASGRAGTVWIGGYTTGAILGPWALAPGPSGAWALSATVARVTVPRGWIAAGRDLSIGLPELTGGAAWRVRSVALTDRALRAVLDPPVKTL